MTTFVLFIKEPNAAERMYGFHLGTVEQEARKIVEERWAYRTQPTNTLPQYEYLRLEFGGKPFAVYDGKWGIACDRCGILMTSGHRCGSCGRDV